MGVYNKVDINKLIKYTMDDGRKVTVTFESYPAGTKIEITFEAEEENSIEIQKNGWQSILSNFKKYVEKKNINHTVV